MKAFANVVAALGLAVSSIPAIAVPMPEGAARLDPRALQAQIVLTSAENSHPGARRHLRHRYPAPQLPDRSNDDWRADQANGGYVVNRYGYGNYVGGPGGFAGYPAGSGAAFIYRQQQNEKCEYAPETC